MRSSIGIVRPGRVMRANATHWAACVLATRVLTVAFAAGALFTAGAPSAKAETQASPPEASQPQAERADPRAGDPAYERSQRLFGVVRDILDRTARMRLDEMTNPQNGVGGFVRRQFGVDRDSRVQDLLASAFELMTDAPVVEMQRRIANARGEIDEMRERIGSLREERIAAPEDGGWETFLGLADDKESLTEAIEELERRIAGQEATIAATKEQFAQALSEAGAQLSSDQIDLLLESVTGSDIVELAAAYEAVRGVSAQLRDLMDESGEDLDYARRYYGMHTALIALLVEAQTQFLEKIDGDYLPKLAAIEGDIDAAARETQRLLDDDPSDEHRRVLEANQESQAIAREALELYRDYLLRQRAQVAAARESTARDLRVADNTLRTVDASFQLRAIMENADTSFNALQSLEAPGFERLFRNEQLRREFQELTDQLEPSS